MEKAQAVLKRLACALRLRRGLLALSVSAFLVLAILHAFRGLGLSFPYPAFGLSLLPPLCLSLFPLCLERGLFWSGRRLGVGGRLAGLAAALRQKNPVFISGLLENLSFRPARLFFPEAFSLLPSLILGLLLLLPPGTSVPPPSFSQSGEAQKEAAGLPAAEPGAQERAQKPVPSSSEIPRLPPGFPGHLHPLVLSALLGGEVSLEDAVRRLSREEGLLRRLAELLDRASSRGSLTELEGEIGEILGDLERSDLRDAFARALVPGREEVERAQALVEAALEGVARAKAAAAALTQEAAVAEREGPEGRSSEGEGPAGQPAEPSGEIVMDDAVGPSPHRELGEVQEGLGLGAGWEEGEPVAPGVPSGERVSADPLPTAIRPGQGPLRTGVALSLPGEDSGGEREGETPPSPQDVEIFLRESPLPPALRELVRRYFELLSGGGS